MSTLKQVFWRCPMAVAGAVLLWTFSVSDDASAQKRRTSDLDPGVILSTRSGGAYPEELLIPLNKSRIIHFGTRVAEAVVGNAEIADVIPLTDKSIYVLGKSMGSTSLSIYGPRKTLIEIIDVQVTPDTSSLKRQLYDLMPQEQIGVGAAGTAITLSGNASSSAAVHQAVELAGRYAGEVVNLVSVTQSEQVQLSVRFAEVKRSTSKALGLSGEVLFDNGATLAGLATGILNPDAFAVLDGMFDISGNWSIEAALDILEEKGLVSVLAEPTLMAMTGQTASFLAGGEFPIPVANDASGDDGTRRVSVEFKQFGVSLAFTPTVIGDTINLVVSPEVSALDEGNGVVFNGLTVPALTTRRAETTVELKDGQSFAIAGLLQNEFSDTIRQLPGLGDIPILGALFRSSSYQRRETELVILITPHLVKPSKEGDLLTPTDLVIRPSEFELFMLGKTDNKAFPHYNPFRKRDPLVKTAEVREGSQDGLDGTFGYILE